MRQAGVQRLRQLAKRVGPLYWLAGLTRYVGYRIRLRKHDREYASSARPGIPPPRLRHRVHGAFDEVAYLNAGNVIAREIAARWKRHATSPEPVVLDFGCGPGRVAVHFKDAVPSARMFGSDIDREAIEWASSSLARIGTFDTNTLLPRTRYEDASFDLVYTVSVLTHLDEASQFLWLEELHRVLRPGGLLIATVHGALATQSCTPAELHTLNDRGFVFRTDRTGRFKLDGLPDSYQTTFHTAEYVRDHWTRWFDLVEYIEGGIARHQDLVVLKARRLS